MQYEIEFYKKQNGASDLVEWLDTLRRKSKSDKNARVQLRQVALYIELLQNNGTHLPNNIVKHLEDGIWEIRPGNNRVLLFFIQPDATFVLLHHFRKKTQKTPRKEIERAKSERKDYLDRRGRENDHMERV